MVASAQRNSQTEETYSIILHGRICSTEQSNRRDLQYYPSWPHLLNRTVKHKGPTVLSFMAASARQNSQTQGTYSIILHGRICSTEKSNTTWDLQYYPSWPHLLNRTVKHKRSTVSSYKAASVKRTVKHKRSTVSSYRAASAQQNSQQKRSTVSSYIATFAQQNSQQKRSTVSSIMAASAQQNSQTEEIYSIILRGHICSTEQSNKRDLQYHPTWPHLLNRTIKHK